ncbi:PWWP domain-containing DNA repair factor 3B isoform X2 [Corythoichthys intestinalis]|uniref:PWWP domain-containing DNA repair factor 3B isoform X2 n=1 Tax=Corythoichthys intestinalis TaxID=161448 RepID=UPI0025A4D532|nr:PWWP domain-containing DNA repair factor 3B isoform X2 [Corythoichthys intestinalis]
MGPTKTSRQKGNTGSISSSATEEPSPVACNDFHTANHAIACSTPKRRGRKKKKLLELCPTSTPFPQIYATRSKTSEVESPRYTTRAQSRKRGMEVFQSQQFRKRQPITTCSPVKRRCLRKNTKESITALSSEPSQSRFETKEDLIIEKSDHEELLSPLSLQEDEKSDEDEELPSFLTQSRSPSISDGEFVWCKYRHFPKWPALVKRINHKAKKASIVYIDKPSILQKKGCVVPLKSLTPFDFKGAKELPSEAKEEQYAPLLQWSLDVIFHYEMHIAINTFSGSFIEYFAHDTSYPVRRKYPQAVSEKLLTNASDSVIKEENHCIPVYTIEDYETQEQPINFAEQEQPRAYAKRILPDRTQAAYNRANEKFVDYIVKQRKVEEHLKAVIRGQVQSKWLHLFQKKSKSNSSPIVYYLQDGTQLEKVYRYLSKLYKKTVNTTPCQPALNSIQRLLFVPDVLLHEAMTYAIAGLDNVSVTKAEEKYLEKRCLSNRERQAYDRMIERHWIKEYQHPDTTLS